MALTRITEGVIKPNENYVVNNINSIGVTTSTNFKTGTSNLHNVGIEIAGINVLGADTPIGTGATIYDAGGAVFTGVVTATSFSGAASGNPTLTNGADNRVITATGANAIQGESTLNYGSDKLIITGSATPPSGTSNNYSLNIYRDGGSGYGYFDVVTNSSNHTGVKLRAYHNGTYNNVFEHTTSDLTRFYTGGKERLRIGSNGSVGIGTDNLHSNAGVYNKLTVDGDTTSQIGVAKIVRRHTGGSSGTYTLEVDSSSQTSNVTSSGAMGVTVNNGRAFTINALGNVSIATDLPRSRLDVFETVTGTQTAIRIGNTNTPSSANDRRLEFVDGTGTSEGTNKFTYAYIQGYRAGGANSGDLIFGTKRSNAAAPVEAMRIDDNGYLGIGIDAPGAPLDVDGWIQSTAGFKTAGHPIATYASFTDISGGSYATRLGSTGSSTLRSTQIYGGGSHIATFDGVNNRLGINIAIPTDRLHVKGANNDGIKLSAGTYGGGHLLITGADANIGGTGSAYSHTVRLKTKTQNNNNGNGAERDALIFYHEGWSGLHVASFPTGKVGINETNPDHIFHIKGSTPILAVESSSWSSGVSAALRLSYTDGNAREIRGHYDHGLQFFLNAGEALRIDTSNKLQMGSINGNTQWGQDWLNIESGGDAGISIGRLEGGSPTNGQILGSYSFQSAIGGQNAGSAEAKIQAIAAENQSGSTAATDMVFYTKASGTGPGSAPAERMRINKNGLVFINNTTQTDVSDVHHLKLGGVFRHKTRNSAEIDYGFWAMQTGSGSFANGYFHMKTDIPTNTGAMFLITVKGYAYGAGKVVFCETCGYCYSANNAIINTQSKSWDGTTSVTTYKSSDSKLVIRFTPGGWSSYYMGFYVNISQQNPAKSSLAHKVTTSTIDTSSTYYA